MRFIIYLSFILSLGGEVWAQKDPSRAALEAEKKKNLEKIDQVKKVLSQTQKQKNTSVSQAKALQKQIENQEKKISLAQEDINLIQKEMKANQASQNQLRAELSILQKEYGEIIVREAKNSTKLTKMGFLFSSSSLTDLFMRYKYLQHYAENRKVKFEKIRTLTDSLKVRETELSQNKVRKDQVITQVSEDKKGLDQLKSKQDIIVKELTSKEGELKVELKKQQQALTQLNSVISVAIAKERAARKAEEERIAKERAAALAKKREEERQRELARAREAERAAADLARRREAERVAAARNNETSRNTESAKTVETPKNVEPPREEYFIVVEPKEEKVVPKVEPNTNVSKPVIAETRSEKATVATGKFSAAKMKLSWPVNGFISTKFGVRDHAVLKGIKVDNHGVDIRSVLGADVRTVFEGTVLDVSQIPGLNYVVAIQHGDYYTVYANLVNVTVRENQKVNGRDIIGKVAERDGVAEINFQVWHNFTKLNPELWLGSK